MPNFLFHTVISHCAVTRNGKWVNLRSISENEITYKSESNNISRLPSFILCYVTVFTHFTLYYRNRDCLFDCVDIFAKTCDMHSYKTKLLLNNFYFIIKVYNTAFKKCRLL